MRKWKTSEIEFLRKHYLLRGAKYCAAQLSRSECSVHHKTEILKLLKPRRSAELQKFEDGIEPHVAYLLGLLWADGAMGKYDVSLPLIKSDMDEIKHILLRYGQWSFYLRRPPTGTTWKPISIARLCNKGLREFLERNDFRHKSKYSPTKLLGIISPQLHSYFWRGFLDGDGCIYVQKHKNWKFGTIALTGSYEQDWKDLIARLNKLKVRYRLVRETSNRGHKCSRIVISNLDGILIFGKYVYRNRESDQIGFRRKYNNYLTLASYVSV